MLGSPQVQTLKSAGYESQDGDAFGPNTRHSIVADSKPSTGLTYCSPAHCQGLTLRQDQGLGNDSSLTLQRRLIGAALCVSTAARLRSMALTALTLADDESGRDMVAVNPGRPGV